MSDSPAVSIVVPVFNDAARLRRCLEAVARFTFSDFEVIVVDDRSTDGGESVRIAEAAGAKVVKLDRNGGPAVARNAGARQATGVILYFVDADCLVHPDSVGRVVDALADGQPYDAVFGSYDDAPEHPALVSRWKNLAHRFTHQQAREEAGTFWCGCGAVRREAFLAHGGFDETFGRPCIEDVEFGMRLKRAGHRIKLDKLLQVKHLKRWRLGNLVKTDIFDRGVPWTRILLSQPPAEKLNDLNVTPTQKLAALLAAAIVGGLLVGGFWRPGLWVAIVAVVVVTLALDALTARGASWRILTPILLVAVLAGTVALALHAAVATVLLALGLAALVAMNGAFYRYLARIGGFGFATASVVPHVVYYLCALTGYALALAGHLLRRPAPGTSTVAPS